jgi:hypothetical protein
MRLSPGTWENSCEEEAHSEGEFLTGIYRDVGTLTLLLPQCFQLGDRFEVLVAACRALDMNQLWETQTETLGAKQAEGDGV